VRTIPHMRELFGCEVGLSDHSLGVGVSLAAVALGATVVEKHFTLSRADGGVDSAFSMEPDEMRMLVEETEKAWQALGEVSYGPTEQERGSLRFRRSLYVACDMKEGDMLDEHNLRSVRPGYGLPPKHYQALLGKRVNRDVAKGTPVSWDLIG
jgi:sialic acid synthase SpsE